LNADFEIATKALNGTSEHIHLLFLLNPIYAVSDVIKGIKGESSHWINSEKLLAYKFAWQTGYGAFSVSESMVGSVEKYILNQKEHHKTVTFADEYELFMKKHGMNLVNR